MTGSVHPCLCVSDHGWCSAAPGSTHPRQPSCQGIPANSQTAGRGASRGSRSNQRRRPSKAGDLRAVRELFRQRQRSLFPPSSPAAGHLCDREDKRKTPRRRPTSAASRQFSFAAAGHSCGRFPFLNEQWPVRAPCEKNNDNPHRTCWVIRTTATFPFVRTEKHSVAGFDGTASVRILDWEARTYHRLPIATSSAHREQPRRAVLICRASPIAAAEPSPE
ncbi:RING/U-box superfamily protein [Striga asiatica]|uniref:RING/U-box superfamily protein n=1 Tax=Striga asiatica TaxID=4170 RepID=A0A5A7QKH7_STRAF|nr:RING/U-box superfamily protein [Striga asiatica]